MAFGDLTSSSGNELVVELEGGNATGNTTGVGRAVVLSSAQGAQLSKFDGLVAGNDFMGFPMIENLDACTGFNEYLVAEFGQATPLPGAAVYARSGDSVTAKVARRRATASPACGTWGRRPATCAATTRVTKSSSPTTTATSWCSRRGDATTLNSCTKPLRQQQRQHLRPRRHRQRRRRHRQRDRRRRRQHGQGLRAQGRDGHRRCRA